MKENESQKEEDNTEVEKVVESTYESLQEPFACGFCEKSFSLPMSLQMHIDNDHSSTQKTEIF